MPAQTAATPTVGFYTLGCKLNFSESSTLARQCQELGMAVRPFHEPLDAYVINTCSVTEQADRKCRRVVRQALRHNPQAKVVVVGCYAQLKPQAIQDIPGVTAVLGAAEKFDLAQHLHQLLAGHTRGGIRRGAVEQAHTFIPSYALDERTRAFVKVQDGCDYKCSFCTIPLARGASRSQPLPQVLEQLHHLAAQDVQEVVLTGINLGDYGANPEGRAPYSLVDLVQAIDAEAVAIPRFRLSSVEPNLLHDDLLAAVAASPRFVPHFHIPLQSGSDEVLGAMRRRYRTQLYRNRIATIRRLMPDAGIGVDVITGFVGETDAHFAETLAFLTALDVTYLHVFPYSERANTHALVLDGAPVPIPLRDERCRQLRTLSDTKRRAFARRYLGQSRPVLVEEAVKDGHLVGYTDNYIRVRVPYDPLLPNTVTTTHLAGWDEAEDLVDGQPQAEPQAPEPLGLRLEPFAPSI